jgi:glycosyltransferase involved in cell wall biosynthesis
MLPGKRATTFLYLGQWDRGHGVDALIRAFVGEFEPHEDVALVMLLAATDRPPEELRAELAQLIENRTATPSLQIQLVSLTPDMLPQVYRAADAYIHPHRTRGWQRRILEACCTGLPVIASAWNATPELCSYAVPAELAPVERDTSPADQPLLWGEPSVEALGVAMREVAENRSQARERAEAAREFALANHGLTAVSETLRGLLEEALSPVPNREPLLCAGAA